MLCMQNYVMQLTDEDAVVVAKAYFSSAILPNLTVTKVRQACLIKDIKEVKVERLVDDVLKESGEQQESEAWKTSSFNQGRHSGTVTYKYT